MARGGSLFLVCVDRFSQSRFLLLMIAAASNLIAMKTSRSQVLEGIFEETSSSLSASSHLPIAMATSLGGNLLMNLHLR